MSDQQDMQSRLEANTREIIDACNRTAAQLRDVASRTVTRDTPRDWYTVTDPSGVRLQGVKSLIPDLVAYWREHGYTVTPYVAP